MARLTLKSQGELVSFLSAGKADIRSLKVHFTPKQAGTGDPSPENVRAISGWDGITVNHGRNILDGLNVEYRNKACIRGADGAIVTYTAIGSACTTYIDVREYRGMTLTLNHRPTGNNGGFAFYSNPGSFVSGLSNKGVSTQGEWTITIPTDDNINYMRFTANPNYIDDVKLVLNQESLTIPFPQTIYGGYVDLISGEVVEEWGIIASYNGETLASEWLSDRDVYASGTTPTIGAQVAYKNSTPITHQLTPTEIQTLTGQNTFWSSADSIEVEYDLIETRDTWMNRKHMFALSSPHTESMTGTFLQFTTDMASNLKECKIHFTPVQEGSGDPSPDNVRPIVGWDGVTVTRCGKNLFVNQNGRKSYVGLKAGVTYTISYCADSNAYFRGINENGSYITNIIWMNTGVINERRYGRITPSIDIPYGVIYRSSGLSEAQIEVGSEATSYEPYESTTLTIPFPQTIYGGYVDLVNGEVVEEWANASIDELNWTLFSNNQSRQAWRTSDIATVIKNISNVNDSPTAISQSFRQVSYNGTWGTYAISQSLQGTVLLTVPSSSYNTAEEFITALAGEIIVYQLATPTTYPLDPVTIKTLKGINNIWSDANGNIEIKYWTH